MAVVHIATLNEWHFQLLLFSNRQAYVFKFACHCFVIIPYYKSIRLSCCLKRQDVLYHIGLNK